MRFSTILLAAGTASLAIAAPLDPNTKSISKRVSKFKFFGINESGPEFGEGKLPGTLNTDYVWPTLSTIDTFVAKGMNTIRINIMMERLVPNKMTGAMDATYLSDLTKTVNYITNKGAYAMIVPHNYGRYYGSVITSTADFGAFWKTVATSFKSNSKVIFDTNNECKHFSHPNLVSLQNRKDPVDTDIIPAVHDMSSTSVAQLNQAAINAIRGAGATTQYITVEGNAWTGAWTWTTAKGTDGKTNAETMGSLTDSGNKLIYQMHQYLDSDGSGTNTACVSATIGKERLVAATKWLRDNKKLGLIGEFAGANNDVCKAAVKDMLAYMNANTDVWTGALWWAAGPWWGSYMVSLIRCADACVDVGNASFADTKGITVQYGTHVWTRLLLPRHHYGVCLSNGGLWWRKHSFTEKRGQGKAVWLMRHFFFFFLLLFFFGVQDISFTYFTRPYAHLFMRLRLQKNDACHPALLKLRHLRKLIPRLKS